MVKKIIITGAAGFIGFHLAKLRLAQGDIVLGIDDLNEYYDVSLKLARLELLEASPHFNFAKTSIEDKDSIDKIFAEFKPDIVVNLAAQAGVRYSLQNPFAYINANLLGFATILEACRHHKVAHLVYASSSSVYGANSKQPFSESDSVDHPLSLYAATKKSNELMAHTYSNLYHLPTTGLRFFTVYGPWGRPDMALFKFTKNIIEGKPIEVYNHGKMVRDFTYVDDIVEGVSRTLDKPAEPLMNWDANKPDSATSFCPYRIYNIGNSSPVSLMDYIKAIEDCCGKKANINYLPMQDGDVASTHADVTRLQTQLDYKPSIPVGIGVRQFVAWYRDFYNV